MKHYGISKLLKYSTVSKFVTRNRLFGKSFIQLLIFSQQKKQFKTGMLRSNLCDYNNAYTVVKGKVYVLGAAGNENDKE